MRKKITLNKVNLLALLVPILVFLFGYVLLLAILNPFDFIDDIKLGKIYQNNIIYMRVSRIRFATFEFIYFTIAISATIMAIIDFKKILNCKDFVARSIYIFSICFILIVIFYGIMYIFEAKIYYFIGANVFECSVDDLEYFLKSNICRMQNGNTSIFFNIYNVISIFGNIISTIVSVILYAGIIITANTNLYHSMRLKFLLLASLCFIFGILSLNGIYSLTHPVMKNSELFDSYKAVLNAALIFHGVMYSLILISSVVVSSFLHHGDAEFKSITEFLGASLMRQLRKSIPQIFATLGPLIASLISVGFGFGW